MAENTLPISPTQSDEKIKQAVRERYARTISQSGTCCCSSGSDSCGPVRTDLVQMAHYNPDELEKLPTDAVENSLGCGNPLAFAEVQAGDIVLDIGSGAGIDVLLASRIVGPTGRIIGLDMTPEMIERARANAVRAGAANVEFRQGDADQMPVADANVDWIISNCVINLAPDKRKVFSEVYRVLKPGGRVSISDIVTGRLPNEVRNSMALWASCIGGAIPEAEYLGIMREMGLVDIEVASRQHYDVETIRALIASNFSSPADREMLDGLLANYRGLVGEFWSAKITARKPA
ncbi:MAG: arsenite methyltransferase [Dehalococcoidia bacterium]|nr:arsenite methyltransferase [Dehalococcoidia bacterium]